MNKLYPPRSIELHLCQVPHITTRNVRYIKQLIDSRHKYSQHIDMTLPTSTHARAILIDVIPPDMKREDSERRLHELELLTQTYGGIVVVSLFQKRAIPHYHIYRFRKAR